MALRDDPTPEAATAALTGSPRLDGGSRARRPTVRRTQLPEAEAHAVTSIASGPPDPGVPATPAFALVAASATAPHAPLAPAERALITLLVELALKPWMPGT